ncbi:3673_t:CDS:2, partial [Ambispora gerdemannii]
QNVIPSLSEFVRLNVDFVARSSTQTSDLLGLEGAWAKRFDSTAKILNIEEIMLSGASVGFTDCGCYIPNIADIVVLWELQSGLLIAVVNDKADWSCIIERWHMMQISGNCREKTYTLYSNVNENFGNKLLENEKKSELDANDSTCAKTTKRLLDVAKESPPKRVAK